jgi:prevent-host-death family protein
MKQVALAEIKDDFSRFLREASKEELVITRHGKPAGILVGFATEDDWLDHNLENNPEFLSRIASARASLERGEGISLAEYKKHSAQSTHEGSLDIKFDESGRAVFTQATLEHATATVLKKLQDRLRGRNIKAARVSKHAQTVTSDFYRIRRAKSDFSREFNHALEQLVDCLAKGIPDDWKSMALELGYSDSQGFKPNNENMFAEYLYFFARVVKLESE